MRAYWICFIPGRLAFKATTLVSKSSWIEDKDDLRVVRDEISSAVHVPTVALLIVDAKVVISSDFDTLDAMELKYVTWSMNSEQVQLELLAALE